MTIYKEFNFGSKSKPLGNFGPLIGLVVFIFIMYFVITGLFKILSVAAPFLLIGAALLDYTVITDYAKFIFKLLKENPLFGLLAILLTIVGIAPVSGFLFFKAWARRSLKKHMNAMEREANKYEEYEEVKEVKEDDFLILPKIEKPAEIKQDNQGNNYQDLFK
jgi:predicted membrane protein